MKWAGRNGPNWIAARVALFSPSEAATMASQKRQVRFLRRNKGGLMDGERRATDVRGYDSMSRRRLAGVAVFLGTLFVLVTASAAAAATVTVTPANGTATVGQAYCVTATVTGPVEAPPPYVIQFTAAPTSGSTANPVPESTDVSTDRTTRRSSASLPRRPARSVSRPRPAAPAPERVHREPRS